MDKPDIPDFFTNPKNGGFDPDKFLSKYKFILIAIVALFLIVPNIVILVGAGQRAVIFNRITGIENRVLPEGVNLIIPFVQEPTIYNVREISYLFTNRREKSVRGAYIMGNAVDALTNDGQNILIEATVRARPDFKELWWIHENLGNDTYSNYVNKIIVPAFRSILREEIANYTVSQIYTERAAVAQQISEKLKAKLSQYKVVLSEFLFDQVTFSPAYQNAVEEKQKATIELGTKDNIIMEEQSKRDAVIIKAQGEAEAINLKVNALINNPSYIKYRKAQILGQRTKMVFTDDSL